jgi:AmmeMemoRadiSam system protein B
MIRQPAVAGRFYPGTADSLTSEIRNFTNQSTPKVAAIGAVIPHAGYMYSGHVAGAVYSRIQLSARSVILCPNHTGYGPPLSIMKSGKWVTPLGAIEIDEAISAALVAADPKLQDDIAAHRYEHAIEVQLPFLQLLVGGDCRFVPITVGTADWDDLEILGNTLAHVIRSIVPEASIIASSDMNHYESDDITRVKDHKAIDEILQLDARGLYEVVRRERISMCGFGPTTSMLVAAKQLGATKAELVKYATSGDVSGDFDRVVGYAGIAVS